eukprot:4407672-Ditylum_brightwellii.AAC.1
MDYANRHRGQSDCKGDHDEYIPKIPESTYNSPSTSIGTESHLVWVPEWEGARVVNVTGKTQQ